MLDHLDVQSGSPGLGHPLNGQHPTRGVEVVVERVDRQGTVRGQQSQIILGHRLESRRVRVDHIDTDAALRVVGAVRDPVDQRVVPCLRGRKTDRPRLVVGFEFHPVGGGGDLHELQGIGVGIRVIAARVEGDGMPDGGYVVVVVGHGRRVRGAR